VRAARTDANQKDVTDALERAGCEVDDTHRLGGGFADLVVEDPSGYWWLVEVKSAKGKLNERERQWHDKHRRATRLIVVHSAEDALRQMGLDGSFWQETLHATPKEG
jgi:ribosomal protein S6